MKLNKLSFKQACWLFQAKYTYPKKISELATGLAETAAECSSLRVHQRRRWLSNFEHVTFIITPGRPVATPSVT